MKNYMVILGRFFFRYRNVFFPALMIAFFVLFRPELFGGTQAMDIWLDAIGLLFGLLGQAFRIAVIGFAYIRRGGVNKRVYAENLVTQGFFGVCRNPLYVGNLISIFGFTLIYNNPWVYGIAIPFFLLSYNAIVRAEEDFLDRKFGMEYEAYCQRVPRWWPKWSLLPDALKGLSFNWRKVVLKEYSTTYTGLTATLWLLAYDSFIGRTVEQALPYWKDLAMIWALLTMAMLAINYLKKNHLLVDPMKK